MAATKNAHDWHCEEHDTYGWRGESCRHCQKAPSERDNLINEITKLTAERDKATQYWQIAEGRCDALKQQRDELVAAAEAIEIDAEECLDFDECSAMLVPIDAYHKLMEAIASVKEKA